MTRRPRRNFLRAGERRAFFRAWRDGTRYCRACGRYRPPLAFTGEEPGTCDECRGLRRCERCQQDRPVGEFSHGNDLGERVEVCQVCRGYRRLADHERAALTALLATDEPAAARNGNDGVSLGHDPWGRPVRLSRTLRNRHIYIVGTPGSGKTTLMKALFVQDMVAGHGCAFLDLRGDATSDLLGCVPPTRLAAAIYFDPVAGHGPTFNPLASRHPPHVVAEDVLASFKMVFAGDLEPQGEEILRFSLLALLGDRQPHTFADLYTFLVAATYRDGIAAASPSPRLRGFWQHEFPQLPSDVASRVASKLASLLSPFSPAERLFSISESTLDFDALLGGRQVLVANLSKAALGDEPARLLAALLTTAVARAARTERSGDQDPDFYLYAPDFHEYAVGAAAAILSDRSAHRIHLRLAHQGLDQLAAAAQPMLGAVGTLVAFQVGTDDAARLENAMSVRRLVHASTGFPYDREVARRATAEPVRAAARELLAAARTFPGESQPNYEDRRINEVLAGIDGLRNLPFPDDLVEMQWPAAADFLNSRKGTAFVRTNHPIDVTALTVDRPPSSDPRTRDLILARPRRRDLPERYYSESTPPEPLPVGRNDKPRRPSRGQRNSGAPRRLAR